jgi:hypothetical protein
VDKTSSCDSGFLIVKLNLEKSDLAGSRRKYAQKDDSGCFGQTI